MTGVQTCALPICPNVQPDKPNVAERLIEVEWEDTSNTRKEYDADLEIYGYNRSGLDRKSVV